MIIDRDARVVPPRYPDRGTRALMGDALGKADQSDLLASFLWMQEGRIGRKAHSELESERDLLLRDLKSLQEFKADPEFQGLSWECTRAELDAVFDAATEVTAEEIARLEEILRASGEALEDLLRFPDGNPAPRFTPGSNSSPLNTVVACRDQIKPLKRRRSALIADLTTKFDRLDDLDSRRMEFSWSEESHTPEHMLHLDSTEFEILVSRLASRDGMTVLRDRGGPGDLGADGIFRTPDNRIVVAQCKQTKTLPGRAIGSEPVQRFNGTARQEHHADIAVMITNATFSEPARAFAGKHGIHLIDAKQLKNWATWGDSFYEVIGVAAPSPADGATGRPSELP
ncbi:restriction endonuclease [Streptomyces sp. NPDC059943]|uniref:restriction endonuclease n=1 Tax=Streptomyces sp. NPDC059943 TaxID=3347010 RepID=UPI0036487CF4